MCHKTFLGPHSEKRVPKQHPYECYLAVRNENGSTLEPFRLHFFFQCRLKLVPGKVFWHTLSHKSYTGIQYYQNLHDFRRKTNKLSTVWKCFICDLVFCKRKPAKHEMLLFQQEIRPVFNISWCNRIMGISFSVASFINQQSLTTIQLIGISNSRLLKLR